ncbi:hypothetical protein D3C78_1600350 [compost metagenome]
MRQPHHRIATAQQRDVLGAAAGNKRRYADLAGARHVAEGARECHIFATIRAARQRVALLQARQPTIDASNRAFQFLLHDILCRA